MVRASLVACVVLFVVCCFGLCCLSFVVCGLLLFAVSCLLLFVVGLLLFGVWCLLRVVRCVWLLFDVRYLLLFVVRYCFDPSCLLSVCRRSLFVVCCLPLSVVRGSLFVVLLCVLRCCLLFDVCCGLLWFDVEC